MNAAAALLLASLSIWDYPARQPQHEALMRQFVAATETGDSAKMTKACRAGVALLPDDPVWHYNLACSLAYDKKRHEEAFDELEKAIDCGFRDVEAIKKDGDLRQLAKSPRYAQLIEYADEMKTRPLLFGPMATVPATGKPGSTIALGEQNLGWDFSTGSFAASVSLSVPSNELWKGSCGDFYMNRDGGHSLLDASAFPGLTTVVLDQEGRNRQFDLNAPNLLFPYPLFGNSSRAFVGSPMWRSIPRALTTADQPGLQRLFVGYLSNQTWVFPSNADTPPVGTNGDVFASLAPYWITTAGRSFSDLPYLRAALEASCAFRPETKAFLVRCGLLAPTIQTLIRKSLKDVKGEDGYLTATAHPTAFPPNGVDTNRLVAAASALTTNAIPPLVSVIAQGEPTPASLKVREITYATACAWAFVLRTDDASRVFYIAAKGAKEFAFVQTHGPQKGVVIDRVKDDAVRVILAPNALSPTNRVDVMVCGRNPGTGWGAPSYVSFARMDPKAPYSDPVLTNPAPFAAPAKGGAK